ncbi:MAG: 4Fe-4S ferredoxin [Spirochaetae bacterium HGW-Spirochaetae-1]|jgi:ferredoxin|nr:MAG: 4Fe-4S ferredoxin [Spirochaetae bacterium HGW-Spirochaetae-1]
MKRQIIHIDHEKCNGCGLCIPDCPEGALQLIDGKARLVSDLFCDGLGACISTCPQDAIHIEEREAEAYNERRVMENIVKQGEMVIRAHLEHLDAHGETRFLNEALEYLVEQDIAVPEFGKKKTPAHQAQGQAHQHVHKHIHAGGGGCPGAAAMTIVREGSGTGEAGQAGPVASQLRQWPVQLKLLNPAAQYFDNAHLLLAADCVPFAYGDFHNRFLKDKIVIMFCPKLDPYVEEYVDKMTAILTTHEIQSITVLHMEVPCCGGVNMILKKAMERAGKNIFVKDYTISIKGEII